MSVCMYVFMHTCVCVRETQTDRQTDRRRETESFYVRVLAYVWEGDGERLPL